MQYSPLVLGCIKVGRMPLSLKSPPEKILEKTRGLALGSLVHMFAREVKKHGISLRDVPGDSQEGFFDLGMQKHISHLAVATNLFSRSFKCVYSNLVSTVTTNYFWLPVFSTLLVPVKQGTYPSALLIDFCNE